MIIFTVKMTESVKQTIRWKRHEVEEEIGLDQCKLIFNLHRFKYVCTWYIKMWLKQLCLRDIDRSYLTGISLK